VPTDRPLSKKKVSQLDALLSHKPHRTNSPVVDESALVITEEDVPF